MLPGAAQGNICRWRPVDCAHAFSRTRLRKFTAPPSLRRIEKRAFFRCRELQSVTLNEGLVEIGEEAFAESGVTGLRVPASVRRWPATA